MTNHKFAVDLVSPFLQEREAVLYYQLDRLSNDRTTEASVSEMTRKLYVNIARNAGENISHITMEFQGEYRSHLMCCFLFDGSGEMGTGYYAAAMPKVKLQRREKALMAISCLHYLCDSGYLKASGEFFLNKVISEYEKDVRMARLKKGSFEGPVVDISALYAVLSQSAKDRAAECIADVSKA